MKPLVQDTLVVGAPRPVDPDQHLVRGQDLRRVDLGAPDDAGLAIGALLQFAAGTHDRGQADNRIIRGLPMDFGQHHVGRAFGEGAALDRRELERIADAGVGLAERRRSRARSWSTIEHSSMTMSPAREQGPSSLRVKVGAPSALARPVDQRMDRRRAGAALSAHHRRRLPGEGGERRLARRALGDIAGKGRLAHPGVAEQWNTCWHACFQPPPPTVSIAWVCSRDRRHQIGREGGGGVSGATGDAGPRLAISRGLPPASASVRPSRRSASRPAAGGRDRHLGPAGEALTLGSELPGVSMRLANLRLASNISLAEFNDLISD